MDKEKKYKIIIIVLSVVIVILLTLCILFATGVINFKSNDETNQKVNIKEEDKEEIAETEEKIETSEEQDLVTDNNQSSENIVPTYNNVQENNSYSENKTEENSSKEEVVIDVKKETWLKLVGGWKTEKMDQPGLHYNTQEEMEKYGDEYAYVYGYLYFDTDYKLYYSYCAISQLQNHDDYAIVKVIDTTHIDVKNSEHYISTLDENTLIIDGIKFIKNNEIRSTDFYDSNGNFCPSNYHCPIYSK